MASLGLGVVQTLAWWFRCAGYVLISVVMILTTGYPRHRENRENGQKKSLSGKTQGIRKCCQNTGKTQGILSKHRENTGNLLAQVVNVLILKVKDIAIVAAKKSIFY